MISSYYKIPLQTKALVENKDTSVCSLEQSIKNFIHLIITTHYGECRFDESFGCYIWSIDFDNLSTTTKLKENITQTLHKNIITNEKRLSNVVLEVDIQQDELKSSLNQRIVKKRVDIKIEGVIKLTNESFYCIESFYIAPLSF